MIHSHPGASEVYGLDRVHSQSGASVVDDMDEEDSLCVRSSGATRGQNLYVRVWSVSASLISCMKHARCVRSRASRVPVGHRELSNQLPQMILFLSIHKTAAKWQSRSFLHPTKLVWADC